MVIEIAVVSTIEILELMLTLVEQDLLLDLQLTLTLQKELFLQVVVPNSDDLDPLNSLNSIEIIIVETSERIDSESAKIPSLGFRLDRQSKQKQSDATKHQKRFLHCSFLSGREGLNPIL